MTTKLSDPIYNDEAAARAHFERIRWPNGRVCPHCGVVDNSTELKGKTTRAGLYKCNAKECRKPFSAIMGTVYEKSHVPLHKWLLATYLLCSSKKGISSVQLQRMLGFGSYRTAWFVAHRIREAMKASGNEPAMGSGGTMVEADETFYGRVPGNSRMAIHNMNKIVSLVDRATGRAASTVVIGSLSHASIGPILAKHMADEAVLMTDEAHHYKTIGTRYVAHHTVNHARGEYVQRGNTTIHSNTIEGFFSVFKKGMKGIYQHCGSQHLARYLSEFDFRYSNREALGINDIMRTDRAVAGTVGRRLTYKKPHLAV
ncbi:IS1595 family transposase [Sphingomonas panacisoli]|uniref:IS1595 family transposase n=1 Tax=Sphingomonas panacisoli TaxID=1813879 RepID=A0A5B8LG27_9SPHN|nr:IS1595 family transposase [Sphingomonas panacisoli]QDZ06602.1 IS1595 family transposase [Sphingomonas panacisoli]